jgi:hypothetical protein
LFRQTQRKTPITSKQVCSFLKKRTKKLLLPAAALSAPRAPGNKSLLLLFFRKEDLS